MTTTLTPATPPASAPSASGTHWVPVAEGLWAGTHDGEFLGTVEFVDGGFETADRVGTRIGRSPSLASAQRLLDTPASGSSPMLAWRDDRPLLTAGWLGFATLAVAAVAIALQLFS